MNIKETRKKYIAKYKEVHDSYLERSKKNPAISEMVWEGFVVHLMVRDFLTHIKDLEESCDGYALHLEQVCEDLYYLKIEKKDLEAENKRLRMEGAVCQQCGNYMYEEDEAIRKEINEDEQLTD